MRGEIFYWVFNMSIMAALCCAVILLIRCIRRIPRRVIRLLWLIPLIRMCVPVGLTGKYGLMTLLSRFATRTVVIFMWERKPIMTMMNLTMWADTYFPITYRINLLEDVFAVASLVWLVVAAALLLAMGILYFTTMAALRDAVRLEGNVYISDRISAPAVYGILRPRIILPSAYREQEDRLSYVLMHESAHIRRGDNLLRVIACVLVCVHWFNPMCWVLLKCFLSDMELACDETVLSRCGEGQRKAYALALLSSVEKTNVFASPFGGAKVRLRVKNILNYRKLSALSVVGFAALVLAIAYVLLTNAM